MQMKSSFFDYVTILFLILWSGGFVTFGTFEMWPYFLFPISIFFFYSGKGSLKSWDYIIMAACLVVMLIQRTRYGGTIFIAIQPFLALLDCYLLGKVMVGKFITLYVKILYFFASASLLIWFMDLFAPIHNLLFEIAKSLPQSPKIDFFWDEMGGNEYEYSLYLYNVKDRYYNEGLIRNCGPFFEPGRYVIFLCIAFMINYYKNGQKFFDRKNIIFLLTIVTTFSTTGYAATFFFMVSSTIMQSKRSNGYKAVMMAIMLLAGNYIMGLEFMSEKISVAYSDAAFDTQSRFGAFFYHLGMLGQSPFVGYGPHSEVLNVEKSPNGLSMLPLFWGIPVALFMYVCLYRSYKLIVNDKNISFIFIPFIATLMLVFSQTITTAPLFYFLYGIGSVTLQSKKKNL